jgi:hypothetical protein
MASFASYAAHQHGPHHNTHPQEQLTSSGISLIASRQDSFEAFAHIRWQGVLNWLQVAFACFKDVNKIGRRPLTV